MPGPITTLHCALIRLQMNYVTQISQLGSFTEVDISKMGDRELQE